MNDDESRPAAGNATEEEVKEALVRSERVTSERAERYYDRIRRNIREFLAKKGSVAGRAAPYLLLAPDVFILLWRLTNDPRVTGRNKVLLGSAIAYFILPLDFIPEMFAGPMGLVDDLVLAVYVLNRMLLDTDPEILREHWSGEGDLLETIQRVLAAADNLVGSDLLNKLKNLVK
ncbi:MAG TPA: DUF1232 domain-containing protein [Thermoanaerobaculia bacterium]|nr:DUF1232 domain-containing protein [Thermoanaerobaculia bacterium]